MGKSWKATVAGILDIVSGAFGLLGSLALLIGGSFTYVPQEVPRFVALVIMALAMPLLLVSLLAITGGIYALQRRKWGLALAGSIAAFFPSPPLGIAAIVFTAISQEDFQS